MNFGRCYVTLLVIGSRRSNRPAAGSTLDDCRETSSVFLIKICIQNGVDAGIRGTKPLGNGRDIGQQKIFPRFHLLAPQFNSDENGVEG